MDTRFNYDADQSRYDDDAYWYGKFINQQNL